jgi:hypothetical protein
MLLPGKKKKKTTMQTLKDALSTIMVSYKTLLLTKELVSQKSTATSPCSWNILDLPHSAPS